MKINYNFSFRCFTIMRYLFQFVTFFLVAISSFCQVDVERITTPIVEEGKRLYKSEMASWYGTDIFIEKFKDQTRIGGYFSYETNDNEKCIFFSRGDSPIVIGSISFDSSYNIHSAQFDPTERKFTQGEYDLYNIRSKAFEIIKVDTFFKRYSNSNFNLIPIISNNERKVYILTGPKENGVVIIGNDYLLSFNADNELINKKVLHRNIMLINYSTTDDSVKQVASIHTHLPETGEFITATDICTLMLYEKFAKWGWHYVISKKYVSIWNCQTDQLLTITKKAFEKIYKQK